MVFLVSLYGAKMLLQFPEIGLDLRLYLDLLMKYVYSSIFSVLKCLLRASN